ncbi:hypothetical protein O181_058943 [Austropuccinia psidii MF-1]|uniref:Retrotransposon gag domain-containing protein n=1 Tax=Austropuccinia psidii MF-1 TaxID=1389203 RepID=A0A9Q3EDY8_9BASI|nr:hypothetical protein [Austropuccinia psidii MF-1]
MPIQHSPPARQTRSQARTKPVLSPTPRAPLDGTPEVPQLRAYFGRSITIQEGSESAKEIKLIFRSSLRFSMAFKNQSKGSSQGFIQSFQLIFHNDLANFSQDRKKVLYAASFLIDRAAKWIEPHLSNLTNQDPSYLLNCWELFESQIFTLIGDLNEVRKSEAELDSLRMKEGGHVSLYIADFRSLVSRIGDCGERALIYHFRRGLASRILDQLASHPSNIDSLQDLVDITLEPDTRYHERQNDNNHDQEKKPGASMSNSSHPQNSSSSSHKKKMNFQKRDKPHSSLLKKDFKLMNYEKERRIKEGLCTYCGGKHSLESCFKRTQNKLTQYSGNFPSQGKS